MKEFILTSALVLGPLLVPPQAFAQKEASFENDHLVPFATARRVAVGMTRIELKTASGAPDAMLDANVWVYWDFRARDVPSDKNHDALMVVFEKDRVKFFKFTASGPVRAYLAQQKGRAAN